MHRECSKSIQLKSLLDAIRSSDVVESRAELISKLGDLDLSEKSDLAYLFESLATIWEDFTCLDISQCMLNKTILHVAAKYVNSDLSGCLVEFLALGTKASAWCGKHLKMTIMSSEESQEEEHCNLFFQVLLDFLSLSVASLVALTRYSVSADNGSMIIVERFILEQLHLTKDLALEIKNFGSFGTEMLKVSHSVIDALVKLCKEYLAILSKNSCDERPEMDADSTESIGANMRNHVVNITKCAIEKLCELGNIAANDGGSLVTILNVAWKGVVTLLQLGKGILTETLSVQDIILTLISLVNEPLKSAAKTWSSSLKETVSVTEARRIVLPIKFYLINAVKISSAYPCQAYIVYREITLCILMISTFKVLLSYESLLTTASEVFLEVLENACMDLLLSLLNSAEVKQELKFELLDWLFIDECCSNSIHGGSDSGVASMIEIFSVSCETMSGARSLLAGRVALFHTFLRYSVDLEEDVKIKLTRKLGWLLDILVDEEIYSSVLDLQVPVLCGSGKTAEVIWQPMFCALLQSLRTFMIVLFSTSAWIELEAFLLENLFHSHFLCWEIVMELWCFLVRHAELEMVNGIIGKLCLLMKSLASPESVAAPGSPLRKIARTICLLLSNSAPSVVDHVYSSVADDDRSQLLSVTYVALLLEGFPLNLLSDNIRSAAKQKILTDYYGFIENFGDKMLTCCSTGLPGIAVCALSASLQSRQISISDVDMKTLKFLVAIIRNFRNTIDKLVKGCYLKLLSEMLAIISNMKHLCESDEMEEVILELQNLFISGPSASETQLYQCKPYLALFIGGLGELKISETVDCAKSNAVWGLYHMLFRERHWALVHLAIAAFGYFAARTSCNQLWRFVPKSAALSYDLISGNEASEERFMSELKTFLEKEMALLTITPSFEQLELLVKEGMVLKEMVQKISNTCIEVVECENMEIDLENQSNKRRKLPDGISRGMELLQNGLKVIGDGLSQWQQNQFESSELHSKLLAHFSHLEDEIARLSSLSGTG